MTFIPHTLPEQIALITAEADGRVIYLVATDVAGPICPLKKKSPGYWEFAKGRYEVEQPLVEHFRNAYRGPGGIEVLSTSEYATREEAMRWDTNEGYVRTVHMREVR